MSKYNVYGIGNAIVDLQVPGSDDDLKVLALEKGSMLLVDEAKQATILDYIKAADINYASGGAGANSIIALAQLGARVAYGCVVGDDERGDFYLEEMLTLGVKVINPPTVGAPTGTSVIIITPDSERTMNTHLGATSGFSKQHVNDELIRESEWLLIEGYLFCTEIGQEAIWHAIAVAKDSGCKVLLTLGAKFIPEVFRSEVVAAAEQSDLIICNLEEAKTLAQTTDEEQVFSALERLCSKAVMTMSERGAWVFWEGEVVKVPAVPTTVIDSTGAGDAFAGAFLYGILQGYSPEKAAKLGCSFAAKVVAQYGARLKSDARHLLGEVL